MKVHLTQRMLDRFTPTQGKVRLFDTELPGFLCEVSTAGRKSFHIVTQDEFGRQRQKKVADFPAVSVKAAREQAASLLQAVRSDGAAVLDAGRERRACPTLAEFVRERYLPHVKTTKRSWHTDESILRNHLLPALGSRRLAEITLDDMQCFYRADLARGAARGSANRRIILMRYLFNLAIKWGTPGVTHNPAREVELVDPQNTRERFLCSAEMTRLQEAVESSPNKLLRFIVPALLLTGLRKREVLDARWEHIDFEARTWFVPHTKSGKPRTVQLSDALVALLRSVPRRDEGEAGAEAGAQWVFASPKTGKPFVSIFYAWDTARKKAGLPEVRMHDLRHTFASLLINSSYELYDVMSALGHTQMRTTMRYAHLSRERKRAAVEAVAEKSGLSGRLAANQPQFQEVA
ncbi:Phage integrase family protein [Thauera humireducens]|uniref:site-specific integrase n=1 Tax=Thauera humireducens TaxID=1134435 RepID=UPI002467AC01|nr:site-specific integrase [Thauera humireducens]CAH1746821.1 Phage integrase family protein [Thauera humireducens]CAH1746838.1 Phage integrase family protein [Thauera humireducens]